METKFNSQICTTREQSERLLALGLKKETADMHHSYYTRVLFDGSKSHFWKEEVGYSENAIPAWSLHRLIEIMPKDVEAEIALTNGRVRTEWLSFVMNYACNIIYIDEQKEEFKGFYEGNSYDKVVDAYEWLIKEGYFNKDYLV